MKRSTRIEGPQLVIAGLGPAGLELLPPGTLSRLKGGGRLILRTGRHPAAEELERGGIEFESLDRFYESAEGFDQLYPRLAEHVLAAAAECAAEGRYCLYAVPGNPLLGEESVRLALEGARAAGISVQVLSAPGFVDVVAPLLASRGALPQLTEWQVADAASLTEVWWDTRRPVLIFQVDDTNAASRAKLALLEDYPPEFQVWVVRRAGVAGREEARQLPLVELDRRAAGRYDHLTTIYLPPLPDDQARPTYRSLRDVVHRLRAPGGCPWDREQTPASLKRYTLEETYEVLEAVDSEDPERLSEELGDLLLQVLLYAEIGREEGWFDDRDVISGIEAKLIRRHPHVFGDVELGDSEAVVRQWEAIKSSEKPERTSAMDGVSAALPALLKALEVSKKAVKVGFEWPSLHELLAKVDEELAEFRAELPPDLSPTRALTPGESAAAASELADLLFTLVNIARWLRIDPEEALRQMVGRFQSRFRVMEQLAADAGREWGSLNISEMDGYWELAKTAASDL